MGHPKVVSNKSGAVGGKGIDVSLILIKTIELWRAIYSDTDDSCSKRVHH